MTCTLRTCVWLLAFYLPLSVAATAWYPSVFEYDCEQQTEAGGWETAITVHIRPLIWRCYIAFGLYTIYFCVVWLVARLFVVNDANETSEWHYHIMLLIFCLNAMQWYVVMTENSENLQAKWKEVERVQQFCCKVEYEHSTLNRDQRYGLCCWYEARGTLAKLADMGLGALVGNVKRTIVVESWRYTLKSWVTLIEDATPLVAALCVCGAVFNIVWCLASWICETEDNKKKIKWDALVLAFENLLTMMKEFVTSVARRHVPCSLTSAGSGQQAPQPPQPTLEIEPPNSAVESGAAAQPTPPSESRGFFQRIRNRLFPENPAAVEGGARSKAEQDKKADAAAAEAARLKAAQDQKDKDDAAAARAASLKAAQDQKDKDDTAAADVAGTLAHGIQADLSAISSLPNPQLPVVPASSDSTTLEEQKKRKRDQSPVSAAATDSKDRKRKPETCTWKCKVSSDTCKRKRGEAVNGQPGTTYRCGEHVKRQKPDA